MSHIWHGADPTEDVDTADYELGVELKANTDITINSVRVFGTPNAVAFAGRTGKIWDTSTGLVLGTAVMPTNLSAGWNNYDLGTPVTRLAGQKCMVSFPTGGRYGFVASALASDVVALDGGATLLSNANSTAGNGRINGTPDSYPNSATAGTFWGVDVEYVLGISSNTPPIIDSFTASTAGLTVTATITAHDTQGLGSAVYAFEWGDGATSSGASATASHTYATPGLKAVLGTVTDSGGLSDSAATAAVLLAGTGALHPNNELVAVAWLKAAAGYLGSRVATELPTDNSSWSASGFTTISAVGGSPNIYVPIRKPVISVNCWGVTSNSGRPPWNLASQMAEQIREAVLAHRTVGRQVAMPTGYHNAYVHTVIPRTEPRRINADVASYAHYQQDIEFWWSEAP